MITNNLSDTIAAIATPLGTGGVGVIRISGERAFEILSKIFSTSSTKKVYPEIEIGKIHYGWIYNPNDSLNKIQATNPLKADINIDINVKENNFLELIDEVIILPFKAPKSFTGEDVVEIHCHGGIHVVKNILNLCFRYGSRMAEAGEFTKRAFLNKKMDLSKAEAVLDIIHAKTDKFSSVTAYNLSGKLASFINELRGELINLLSQINAGLDFPEEVAEPEYSYLEDTTTSLINKIDKILQSSKTSNIMRQGVKVSIVGKPNVGKSSLFNALLNLERSIVTDIPGTTRDIIQETIDIGGVPVNIVDTAGIREIEEKHSSDKIESIGINIAKSHILDSDIALFLVDLSQGVQDEDKAIFDALTNKSIIKVGTKADLIDKKEELNGFIPISSVEKEGLDFLKREIESLLHSKDLLNDSEFLTNIRQQDCLNTALVSLNQALESCRMNEVQDFIAIDLKSALLALDEITGEVISEEIIDNIFSNFCIGK